jgi:hypothetical protein
MKEGYRYPNPHGITLSVWQGESMIWKSKGHWLLPLFELESFIKDRHLDPATLSVHDTIQGKAAAALCLYLSIGNVSVDLISDGALSLYRTYGKNVSYLEKTERIKCVTESMITNDLSLQEIHAMLRQKAGLTGGKELDVHDLSVPGYPSSSFLSSGKGRACYFDLSRQSSRGTWLAVYFASLGIMVTGDAFGKGQSVSSLVSPIREEAELALRRTGCFDLANHDAGELTHGQTCLVWLAVALASRASLFVVNNPLQGLSRDETDRYLSVIESLFFSDMPTILMLSETSVAGWKTCGESG